MNLFDVFLRPDLERDSDRAAITHAANLLEVGEFQLLQLAFYQWHGREMQCTEREILFRSVFLEKHTPGFLRHYARNILIREEIGELRASDEAYHRYDPPMLGGILTNSMGQFVCISALLFGVLIGSLALAAVTINIGGACTNPFPPCLTLQDLGEIPRVDSSNR